MTVGNRLQMDPMTAEELEAFIPYSRATYIGDRVTNGGEDRRDAEEVAAKQMAAFFPAGAPAEGHCLFTGRDATTTERIGVLWLFQRRSFSITA